MAVAMLRHSGCAMSQWLCYVAVAVLWHSGYAMSQWLCRSGCAMAQWLCYVAVAMSQSQRLCCVAVAMSQRLCYVAEAMSQRLCNSGYVTEAMWQCDYVAVAMVMGMRTFRIRLPFALYTGRCQIQAT